MLCLFNQKEKFTVEKQQKKINEKFEEIGGDIVIGAKVKMKQNRQVGIVKEIKGKKAVLQVGVMPITVDLKDLVVVKDKEQTANSFSKTFGLNYFKTYFCSGELAEWSIAAVLKTVDCYRSWGSNP